MKTYSFCRMYNGTCMTNVVLSHFVHDHKEVKKEGFRDLAFLISSILLKNVLAALIYTIF